MPIQTQSAILEFLPANIALLNAKGVIVAVNAAWREFGCTNGLRSANHAIGVNYLDLCDRVEGELAPDAQRVAAGIRQVLSGDSPLFELEYPCHSPNEDRWFRLMVTPVTLGAISGAVVLHLNITDRKIAEGQLQRHQAMLASAVRIANVGSWDYDILRDRLEWSEVTTQIFGSTRQEWGGTLADFMAFVHPEDREATKATIAKGLLGLAVIDKEYRIVRPDGEVRLLHDRGELTCDSNGKPTRATGVVLDITKQRKAEESIRLQAHILDNIGQAVVVSNREGYITYANRMAGKLYTWAPSEMLGRNIREVVNIQGRTGQTADMRKLLEAGESCQWECVVRGRDQRVFPISVTETPLRDPAGAWIGTIAISADISELKANADAVNRAREAAESANRSKSEFLANMSHEIRTPMNGVIGMTSLLLDTELTEEQREYADTVRQSGEALLTVINDILDFSKIESGKLEIESFAFDLRSVIEEVVEMLAPKAAEKSLDVVVEYPPGRPSRFIGDGGRIRQVITNLLGNAVKFTPRGHILIALECVHSTAQVAHMRIAISDTGIGIAADNMDRLFDKFTQADSSTTRRYGGTGLGLAISKQLIELMGGSISVRSNPGQGSTFSLTIPLALDVQPAPLPVTELRGLRVLIVDDLDLNRRVVQQQVTGWGMRSGTYSGGEPALAALRMAEAVGDPYQIAILDYQMPGMDGATLSAAIKSDPTLRNTVVVMLTSVSNWGELRKLEGASIDACLVKPVRSSILLSTLVHAWSKNLNRDSVRNASSQLADAATPASSSQPRKMAQSNLRVLVVEDNIVNQRVTTRLLEKLGVHAEVAGNGREALAILDSRSFDIIFMDCQMPEMNGYDAATRIRSREGSGRHATILAMTAEAAAETEQRCLSAGMDGMISKPVTLDNFTDAIRKWELATQPQAT